jgi:uncharacterized membrane protein
MAQPLPPSSAPDEEAVATFVHSDEYAKNVSQVAYVTTHKIVHVRRKEFAMQPFALEQYPLAEVSSIQYQRRLALLPMIVGVFLVLLVMFIFGSEVPAGTRWPIGALALVFVFGGSLMLGVRRHRFTFMLGDKKLKWQSKAGDYKYKAVSVQRLIDFARAKGLLREVP